MTRLLARLRRRGVTFEIIDGEVHVIGWSLLSAIEKEQMRTDRDNAKARLEAREHRRQRRAARRRMKEQQQGDTQAQQQQRRVVGMVASPGYPHLAKPLYEDETRQIDVRRARVLGTVPYGWRKS
jgi:hypothetical protein